MWFAQKTANKIGRITPRGEIEEFALPTPNAGPDGIVLGPDGNVWFSESEASRIGRITPDGRISEFADGITPGAKPLSIAVRDGALWFSEAAGNRIGRISVDGKVTEFPIPSHDSQPRAMVSHPDGGIWFVETSTNALGRIDRAGRITEHPVPTPNASLRGVTVGADGDLWYTANFANKIGRMAPDGSRARRVRHSDAGKRRALHRRVRRRPLVLHAIRCRADRGSGGWVSRAGELPLPVGERVGVRGFGSLSKYSDSVAPHPVLLPSGEKGRSSNASQKPRAGAMFSP